MSKITNGGLDQYGTEPFEQQQFETAGGEWVNRIANSITARECGVVIRSVASVCVCPSVFAVWAPAFESRELNFLCPNSKEDYIKVTGSKVKVTGAEKRVCVRCW